MALDAACAVQAAATWQPEGCAAYDAGCQAVKTPGEAWFTRERQGSVLGKAHHFKHPSSGSGGTSSSDGVDEGADSCGESTASFLVHSCSVPSSPDAGEEPVECSSMGEEDSKQQGSQGQRAAAHPASHVPASCDAARNIRRACPIALPPGYPHTGLLGPHQAWGVPAFVPFYPAQPLQPQEPPSSQHSASLPSHASTPATDTTACPDSPCSSSQQHDQHTSSSSSTSSWCDGRRPRQGKAAMATATPAAGPVPSTHHPPAMHAPPEQQQHRSSRVKFAPSSRVSAAPPPGSNSRVSSGVPGSASFTAAGLVTRSSLHSRVSLGSSGPLLPSSSSSNRPPLAPVPTSSSRCVTPSAQPLVPAAAPADPRPLVKQATTGDLPAHSGSALSSSRSSGSLSSLASRSSVPLPTATSACAADSVSSAGPHHSQPPHAHPRHSRSVSSALLSPTMPSSSSSDLTALCGSEPATGPGSLDQAPRSCFAPLPLRVSASPAPPSAFASVGAASRVCSPTPPPNCPSPSPPLEAAAPLPIAHPPPPPPPAPRASRAVLPPHSSAPPSSVATPAVTSPAVLPTALHAPPPPRPRVVPAPAPPTFPPRPIRTTTTPPDCSITSATTSSSARARAHVPLNPMNPAALSPGAGAPRPAYPTPLAYHSRVSLPRHHSSCSQPDLHHLAHAPELTQAPAPSRVASFNTAAMLPLSVPGSPSRAGGHSQHHTHTAACPPLPRPPRVQRPEQA